MSANINKKSSVSENTLLPSEYSLPKESGSERAIIDMTNRFYIENSKNVLSEREFEILEKLLIKKRALNHICKEYGLSYERIRQIYNEAFSKVKSVSELLKDIETLKETKNNLVEQCSPQNINRAHSQIFLDKKIIDSSFPFSKRLWNMLSFIECHTLKDLKKNSLGNYLKIRGFKGKCMKEFLQFIEFENMEDEFEEFYKFKKNYNRK